MIIPIVDEGLGNTSYLLDLGDGRALAVDASRDLRALRAAAERRGLKVAFAADTHLHADFLSGALQLAADDGATVLASAAGMRAFEHTGLADGDEVDLGGLVLRALATPGHTGEHLAFVLLDGAAPLGVFSGGSLIVGAAARTDLSGPEQTEALARAQYRSLQRLAALPDETALWPTHGAGSFCSAPPGAERTSTIGAEKTGNPLLRADGEEAFVAALLGSLGSFPPYFLTLPEANRLGAPLLDGVPQLAPLDAEAVRSLRAEGAVVVDVRPVRAFDAAHIPCAVSIPLRAQFASWLGWLLDPSAPYVIVRDPGQDPGEIAWQAAKIGYGPAAGELAGGMSAWDGPTQSIDLVSADRLDGLRVLDVRQDTEYTEGHVPGAAHLELGSLPSCADAVPDGPVVVMCGHGERAMTAASLLARTGHRQARVLEGGPEDWAAVTGRALAEGEK
ncbi:MBL fold metallo-hydrolase [Planomonospora venezuelensis]|uniref:Glyoxylase-like metal-dependent hydrolase (Beta-lactamase superfamily II)/rhodanese-related sulfurtransferase n=1 Tax=Planomonospora venezuelensis TaxID=1999 RepID=A0A841DEM1_PLAVE|nr:MBL fold metallo-hydrolase [Planomonospora venezuelensis]MBB5967213.1 glyoxylase-like metal-dependent hydrolase (beta-lactamase superfamily II)/rhodanese-related sulfurtransferase [Planomonospora venezuelensis]GIN02984.1 Zn-dependent hydrolase [Planomonospora venezuelensis]